MSQFENETPKVVKVGDKVRSFDFDKFDPEPIEGENAYFFEGVVVSITDPETHETFRDCGRYEVRVSRQVIGGKVFPTVHEFVYPPVNGTERFFSPHPTNGVVVI